MTEPVVTVRNGQIRGKTLENYLGEPFFSFLGIPYAKPPVGELRFKAPQPADPWTGVYDATKEGPECPSKHMLFLYYVGSEENCLHLNVYTRNLPQEGQPHNLKPVMVWIHGGAFLYGCNKSELFGPDHLMSEDIVLVCINYRLGVLGFLSLEDQSLEVPGNAGMKDMVLALQWVKDNIRQFNGDPNNVTIFGESAGAAAVHYLYLSPLAKGLFHKAIAQSGSALNCWAKGCHNGHIIANCLGYNFKDKDEKKLLEYLKDVPASKLVKAQHKVPDIFTADAIRPFGPVIEKPSKNAFLTKDPLAIIKEGSFNHVPIIMGYNSKEGIFFEAVRKVLPGVKLPNDFETEINHNLNLVKGSDKSKEIANRIKNYYFGNEKPSEKNIDNCYKMKSDIQFLHGIHRSICEQKGQTNEPIYMYRFSMDSSLNYFKTICTSKCIPLLFFCYYLSYKSKGNGKSIFVKMSKSIPNSSPVGVTHADDLGYLFKPFLNPPLEVGSVEEVSVKKFVKLWANFAKTGNPTPNKTDPLLNVEWKPVTKKENYFLEFDKQLTTGVNPDKERMQFWDSIYEYALS